MATTPAPNPRAHLLSGLRTGGVRSASVGNVPHTAGPAASFNVPRVVPPSQNDTLYQSEEEDELSNMAPQNLYINNHRHHQPAMTAAVDGAANRFSMQQQSMGMNHAMGYNSLTPAAAQNQLQALQLQMMQMEITRLQTIQAQQYQAELIAQAQQAQRMRQQQPVRRSTSSFVPPATAGPTHGSFDLRTATVNAQMRRVNQAEQLRAKLGVNGDEQVPMTAALGGKFGSRVASSRFDGEDEEYSRPPSTPNYTTVISGGTCLGSLASNNIHGSNTSSATSRSDAAVSWRRGATNNSVLSGNRAASSPMVKITPPPAEPTHPGLSSANSFKARPMPLQLGAAASRPMSDTVAVDNTDSMDADDSSSVSSRSNSNSSPSTPNSASSNGEIPPPPLSPREEAVKKLYEGLGIGRPAPTPTISVAVPQDSYMVVQKLASQVVRQPLGPPSNNDDLLPKNFASRSRRKAHDVLLDARERRDVVEAY